MIILQTAAARQAPLLPPEFTPLLGDNQVRSRSPSPPPAVEVPTLETVMTAPVTITVLNYSLLALCEIAYLAILPVYLASAPLSLTPRAIGIFMGGVGIFGGIFQVLCTAALVERWGAKRIYQIGVCALFPLWALFSPAANIAADCGTDSCPWSLWLLVCIGVVSVTVMDMAFSAYSNLY